MKLNYKRVFLVGFAFFLITAFWTSYDAIVPLMLVNRFGLDQAWSGVIMALDNVLAVFMLPIFGSLSDKTKSKYGRRTPYIVIGTLIAVVCFVFLSVADNAQLHNITYPTVSESNQAVWDMAEDKNWEVSNDEYSFFSQDANGKTADKYSLKDYAAKILFNERFSELTPEQQTEAEEWFVSIDYGDKYYYDKTNDTYALASRGDNDVEKSAYTKIVISGVNKLAWEKTIANPAPFICFVLILLLVLIAMATFRSPAVALMPDVTIKPLRSKGNAVINLMGTAGGIVILAVAALFKMSDPQNILMSYTLYVTTVCVVMLIALLVFILKVREQQWVKDAEEEAKKFESETAKDEITAEENASVDEENQVLIKENQDDTEVNKVTAEMCETETAEITEKTENDTASIAVGKGKLEKAKLKSLIFILLSVAFWFIGYNAITSKYSLYATNVLGRNFATTLILAQAAAVVAFIPIGIISSKIGRKKMIMFGVLLLGIMLLIGAFATSETPLIIINLIFAFAGIAWAAINVNSFPMVVELSKESDVGKYTGYYYTASMAAQIITPILSGIIMNWVGNMKPLFFYAALFVFLSFVTMLFVKHGDSKPEKRSALENFDTDD